MDYLVNITAENYNHINEFADVRTKGWPLVDSAWAMVAAIVGYNLIIQLGTQIMKDRKPYDLKHVVLSYNAFVILLNAYIFVEAVTCTFSLNYNMFCNENATNNLHPMEIRFAKAFWWFYVAKYIELFDTAFTVLRKKHKNFSFLHIYHHSSIILFVWIHVKWFPTGNTYATTILNSGGHVLMYGYYTQCLLGPTFTKYLGWKKYITMLQIVQFYVGVSFCIEGILGSCTFYPKWYIVIQLFYVISFVILFSRFYFKSYSKKSKHTNNAEKEE